MWGVCAAAAGWLKFPFHRSTASDFTVAPRKPNFRRPALGGDFAY
jgi:hypothetical protein